MKKIINGKLYNTETATLLGEYNNGYGYSDFHYYMEDLYIKKTGEYFLHGDGGPMSKYSESTGNTTCGISDVIPLTENEAKEWAVEHLSADKYMELFGDVDE